MNAVEFPRVFVRRGVEEECQIRRRALFDPRRRAEFRRRGIGDRLTHPSERHGVYYGHRCEYIGLLSLDFLLRFFSQFLVPLSAKSRRRALEQEQKDYAKKECDGQVWILPLHGVAAGGEAQPRSEGEIVRWNEGGERGRAKEEVREEEEPGVEEERNCGHVGS